MILAIWNGINLSGAINLLVIFNLINVHVQHYQTIWFRIWCGEPLATSKLSNSPEISLSWRNFAEGDLDWFEFLRKQIHYVP